MSWFKFDCFLLTLLFLGSATITSILYYFIPLNTLILGCLVWVLVSASITLLSLRVTEERRSIIFSQLKLMLEFIGFILYPLILVILILSFIIGLFTGNRGSLDISSPADTGDLLVLMLLVIIGTALPMPFMVKRLNRLGINSRVSVSIFLFTSALGVSFGIVIQMLI